MNVPRRALFSVVATLLGLCAVEASAAVVERLFLSNGRHEALPFQETEGGPHAPREIPPDVHATLVEDATTRWSLPPHTVVVREAVEYRVNRFGMRGPEVVPKPAHTLRLLSLGDSTVWGDGVAEDATFTSLAATRLTERWGCPVEPVHGAVPGWDAGQNLVRLKELGRTIDPDVVVIATMWSDAFPQRAAQDGSFVDLGYVRSPLRRLATYRVLRTLLSPWLAARHVRWLAGQQDVADGATLYDGLLRTYTANLRALAAESRELGAVPVFLALPAPFDGEDAPVPETIQEFRAAMAMVAEESGGPLVDGRAHLRANGLGAEVFFDQVHPTAVGHALIGDALVQALADRPPPACDPRPR
ncbi:MAG: hypothetical protein H6742_19150 [Alphaproteobacteria bacterium]|nr:hypothetical protein [Alphaproteobacteria bacterium]